MKTTIAALIAGVLLGGASTALATGSWHPSFFYSKDHSVKCESQPDSVRCWVHHHKSRLMIGMDPVNGWVAHVKGNTSYNLGLDTSRRYINVDRIRGIRTNPKSRTLL